MRLLTHLDFFGVDLSHKRAINQAVFFVSLSDPRAFRSVPCSKENKSVFFIFGWAVNLESFPRVDFPRTYNGYVKT